MSFRNFGISAVTALVLLGGIAAAPASAQLWFGIGADNGYPLYNRDSRYDRNNWDWNDRNRWIQRRNDNGWYDREGHYHRYNQDRYNRSARYNRWNNDWNDRWNDRWDDRRDNDWYYRWENRDRNDHWIYRGPDRRVGGN